MNFPARRKTAVHHLLFLVLLLGTFWLYLPSLQYGFLWDDPIWFGHVLDKTWWQTLLPTAAFQYYRPLTMLYNWLFLQSDGTFFVEMQHLTQIGWHLLNVSLVVALGRRLGLGRWGALAAATLLALLPFAYQAVAWAAPQQPLTGALQSGAWLFYVAGRQQKRQRLLSASVVLYGLALMVQESSVAVAFIPLLYELFIHLKIDSWQSLVSNFQSTREKGWLVALMYPLAAAVYVVAWLLVPRQAGITGWALDGETAVYLAQAFIYPLLGRPTGHDPNAIMPAWQLWGMVLVSLGGLLVLARQKKRGRLALLGLVWALLSLGPAWVGLRFSYVRLAERLFYAPALGIVFLWVSAIWPVAGAGRPWRRRLGAVVWLLIVGQSVWLLLLFSRLYQTGTSHLNQAIATMSDDENGRYLFVNFPDRYLLERPFYPVGFWGVTLAPVSVGLADFPPILTGASPTSTSRSLPWIDTEAREAGPYKVAMRGVIIQPNELYALAAEQDAVYLSRYASDGRFGLQYTGALQQAAAPACQGVRFGDHICLHAAQVQPADAGLTVTLHWSTIAPLPSNQTVFAHLGLPGQPPLAQADGDAWYGMLPLADWQPGDLVVERRTFAAVDWPEAAVIQLGVYDRVSGERLPGVVLDVNGEERPLPDAAFLIDP